MGHFYPKHVFNNANNGNSCSFVGLVIRPRPARYLIDELINDIPEPLVGEFKGSRTISICTGDHRKVRRKAVTMLAQQVYRTHFVIFLLKEL